MGAEHSSIPRRTPLRRRAALVAIALLGLGLLGRACPADAIVLPAVTIDGPSEEIVGFGGIAMAEDGTGGLVYLKRVGGVAHVFVARYLEGQWLAPIRVDTSNPYAASWPRIGAANGGELVVVWATPFATEGAHPVDELLSSTLGPGASIFGPPMIVDPNIRAATGTSPSLAMSPGGQADVVYRVVDNSEGERSTVTQLRDGDVAEDVRVAHFDGERWSLLGAINRDSGIAMRPPTTQNAPAIAVGQTGGAIVVWQEPDIDGIARIWARRIFGSTLDYVMPVSATSFAEAPIPQDADAPAVAISRLGQAEVAYRQATGAGSPLPGPRIFLNTLPDGESLSGSEFEGAKIADSEVPGGASATVGPPSIDSDEKQDLRLLYDADGTPRVIEGNDLGLSADVSLGPGFAGAEPSAVSVMNQAGGGISAWPSTDNAGRDVVAVREDFPEGGVQTGLVSGGGGGEVGELAVGRSGLGDGLVAFRQGQFGDAAIVAGQVSAPPVRFVLTTPKGWLKPAQAVVSWLPAESANGPLSYTVVVDGRRQSTPAGAYSLALDTRGLASGTHSVQVLATDIFGQSTLTPPSAIKLDAGSAVLKVTRVHGDHGVRLRLSDANSGLAPNTIQISFGDGRHADGRKTRAHVYRRPGVYQIVVKLHDKLGNAQTIRSLVTVR